MYKRQNWAWPEKDWDRDYRCLHPHLHYDDVKKAACENSTEIFDKVGHRKENVMLGFFNVWTGSSSSSDIIGKYGDNKFNDNGERLIQMCNQCSQKILMNFSN